MYVTVNQLLQLHSLQSFKLVAGSEGLGNQVASAGILDYEYSDDIAYSRKEVFAPDSFVITSLLFAKGCQEKILPALRQLIEDGASALAYKSIVYNKLPKEVLLYANSHKFPIFSFDDTVYFENIIYEIMSRVLLDNNIVLTEKNIENMIFSNIDKDEIAKISNSIFSLPGKNCLAAYIQSPKNDVLSFGSVLNNYNKSAIDKKRIAIYKYRNNIVILISLDYCDFGRFKIVLEDIINQCRIEKLECYMSYSGIYPTKDGLDICLREGYFASIVSFVDKQNHVHYDEIGTYQFLVPLRNNKEILAFMYRYLEPIIDNEELMKTAVEFVKAKGDIAMSAQRLYCHQNTIRYRVNKLREVLSPNQPANTFFDSLAIAVKAYLLKTE